MSKKTNFKRIALVAVASLSFGVLTSIAPANAALVADDIIIHPTVTTLGSGINRIGDICAITNSATDQSAVIPVSSTGLVLTSKSSADTDPAYLSLSGPGRLLAIDAASNEWVNNTSTTATAASPTGSSSVNDDIKVIPTGVGTIKVSTSANSTSAVVDVITITVVSACSNKVYSPTFSKAAIVRGAEGYTWGTNAWTATVVDDAGYNRVTNGSTGFIRMQLADVYAATLDADAIIASVTSGDCVIGISDYDSSGTADPSAGSGKVAVDSDSGADDIVSVAQSAAAANTPQTCGVSVTYAGTVVVTKTFTFEGAPSKITVSDVTAGSTTANTGLYRVSVTDAAGNSLSGQVISYSSSEANNAAALASGVITNPQDTSGAATISATDATDGKTKAVAYADRADANMTGYTCGKEGVAKITVRTNVDSASSTYITSEPFNVVCGGALDTWTISMDKASYTPGEIATLTLSGKTAQGNPVATFTFLSGVEYSFGGLTAVTAPTNNDAFSSGLGTKTYKFSVGTSEGSFVGTFKTTGTTDDAAKTVQYKVASSTATVTNADVLKSIVSLIASINKQIQALQKLILRR
jgi:hypothetical protein